MSNLNQVEVRFPLFVFESKYSNFAKAAAFGGQPNHALKRSGSVIHLFPPQKNGRSFDVRIWGGGSLPAFRLREPIGSNFAKAAACGGQPNHALKRRGS